MQIEQPTSPIEDFTPYKRLSKDKSNLYLAYHNTSGLPAVVKVFTSGSGNQTAYKQERNILRCLDHPNIIEFYDSKDFTSMTNNNIIKTFSYIVMEFSELGDLCDHIITFGAFSEVLTRMLFHQIIDVVSYLHENGIAHMDLKTDNIMLDENFNVKLIDFDQSLSLDTMTFSPRGTICYRSLEVIKGISGDLKACDVYSLGVIVFVLLTGRYPYLEVSNKANCIRFDEHYYLFKNNPDEFWRRHATLAGNSDIFNNEFKELLTGMLSSDPLYRFTLEDIRNSIWFNGPIYNREQYKREMKQRMTQK